MASGTAGQAAAGVWPGTARCAAAFTFDFDAEEMWLAEDPRSAGRPGVLSQGRYGAKVAVPRLLELLGRHRIKATFFVPGRVAERHPEQVMAIVAAGHELGHHGYTHRPPAALTRDEEERELIRGRAALETFGAPVTGYRAPSWDLSPGTLSLLPEHGFSYSSNLMDDIRPYRHEGSTLVEVPVHWTLDDAAHFWFAESSWTKTIASTGTVRAIWEEEFLGIRDMAGACVFTMHPQIIGRPGRLAFLDAFISFVACHEDVWIATAHEIASRF
jgi:peptidoglycan/xylan/chitin deacetylase (PgdA/CDA1 family)